MRSSEGVGVGDPEVAPVQVVAIGVGIPVARQILDPVKTHIRHVVERDRKRMVLRPNIGRTDVENRVVLVLVEIGSSLC